MKVYRVSWHARLGDPNLGGTQVRVVSARSRPDAARRVAKSEGLERRAVPGFFTVMECR